MFYKDIFFVFPVISLYMLKGVPYLTGFQVLFRLFQKYQMIVLFQGYFLYNVLFLCILFCFVFPYLFLNIIYQDFPVSGLLSTDMGFRNIYLTNIASLSWILKFLQIVLIVHVKRCEKQRSIFCLFFHH